MNDVEFLDGAVKQYSANVIAMNILSQFDCDSHNLRTLYGIVDYKRDNYALFKANAFITTSRVVRKLRQMTIVWKLLIQWKDGTTTWTTLKILKNSNSVEVAEFSVARGILDEPRIFMVGDIHSQKEI